MNAYVVDTNVGVVANGKNEQADCDCVIACIDALQRIYNNGIIVMDDADRFFVSIEGICAFQASLAPVACLQNGSTKCRQMDIAVSAYI